MSRTNSCSYLKKTRNKKRKNRCENTALARENFDLGQWKETTSIDFTGVEGGRVTKMHASMHEI